MPNRSTKGVLDRAKSCRTCSPRLGARRSKKEPPRTGRVWDGRRPLLSSHGAIGFIVCVYCMCDYLRLYKPTVYHSVQTQKHVNRTCLFSIRSNLPHNSSHHVSPFWVSLNPNYRTLTKNLANNNFIDVFNVLIKAETPAWLEFSPYLGDDDLWCLDRSLDKGT